MVFAGAAHFASAATVELVNPLKFPGMEIKSPGELVVYAFAGFAGLIAAVAIAFTVFNGFKLTIASTEEAIKKAQESLKWSVGGFAVALLAFTIISGTAQFLGFKPSQVGQDELVNPIAIPAGEAASRDFMAVINNLMVNFLGIVGFATILMIIYYGYRYLTSAGNEQALEQAKAGLKWSVGGFAVTILAYTIISAIRKLLVF